MSNYSVVTSGKYVHNPYRKKLKSIFDYITLIMKKGHDITYEDIEIYVNSIEEFEMLSEWRHAVQQADQLFRNGTENNKFTFYNKKTKEVYFMTPKEFCKKTDLKFKYLKRYLINKKRKSMGGWVLIEYEGIGKDVNQEKLIKAAKMLTPDVLKKYSYIQADLQETIDNFLK